ncbi:MAG: macro domain-containing protein [Lachnospiraceae bacterium]|nr:macro domain-containing protein [Lachnospiraceae bacterium]
MINYIVGNMFDSKIDCLINTVNCEGYMGKGIAYQFKTRFPKNNEDYIKACKSGKLKTGSLHFFKEEGVTIINFPTKNMWREKSKIEYIEKGLDALVELLPKLNVNSIAIPPLGCGNGGLEWSVVKNLIEDKLKNIKNEYEFVIFEPSKMYTPKVSQAPNISLSGLILLDIRVNLKKFNALRLQKTGFFMNFYAEEEYFKFDKWKYGPYAYSIDIVAKSIKEYQTFYGLKDSKETFDQIYKVICSKKIDEQYQKFHSCVEKASALVNEIKTDKKLEGVATVLFLVQTGQKKNEIQIIDEFRKWSEDKANRFSKEYITDCIEYLEIKNIISIDICGNYELARNALL